jgi:uncharacterized membrane protein
MNAVLVIATLLGCGLMGGVFFAFSVFVLSALARMAPEEGLRAMQAINVAAERPPFLSGFLGTAVLCLVVGVYAAKNLSHPAAPWILAGAALYLLGGFALTMFGNLPLNNALARLDSRLPEAITAWSDYLKTWGAWNHARTLACGGAVVALAIGTMKLK